MRATGSVVHTADGGYRECGAHCRWGLQGVWCTLQMGATGSVVHIADGGYRVCGAHLRDAPGGSCLMLRTPFMLGGNMEAFMVLVGDSENFLFLFGWLTKLLML